MMRSTLILSMTILFIGCSYLHPVEYTYKNSDRNPIISKSNIRNNPIVGVAILDKDDAQNPYSIERGIYDYINFKSGENMIYELDSHDIGSEINLDENRYITNANVISEKYPGMRYVLYMWTNPQHIAKNKYDRPRTITSNGKEKVVWDTEYETSITVDTEMVLFDLIDNTELLRAIKTFKSTASHIDKYEELSSNSILKTIQIASALLDLLSASSDKYPSVDFNFVNREIEDYVYYFLIKINKK